MQHTVSQQSTTESTGAHSFLAHDPSTERFDKGITQYICVCDKTKKKTKKKIIVSPKTPSLSKIKAQVTNF